MLNEFLAKISLEPPIEVLKLEQPGFVKNLLPIQSLNCANSALWTETCESGEKGEKGETDETHETGKRSETDESHESVESGESDEEGSCAKLQRAFAKKFGLPMLLCCGIKICCNLITFWKTLGIEVFF